MSNQRAEQHFYSDLVHVMTHQARAPLALIYGAMRSLKQFGDPEGLFEEMIRGGLEQLHNLIRGLETAITLAQGTYTPSGHLVSARRLAEQAQASREDLVTVTVSGEETEVWVEDEIADGISAIVGSLYFREQNDHINISVDGAEIVISPIPDDEDSRRLVTGERTLYYQVALAVALIRARGGTIDLDRDTLTIRFDKRANAS